MSFPFTIHTFFYTCGAFHKFMISTTLCTCLILYTIFHTVVELLTFEALIDFVRVKNLVFPIQRVQYIALNEDLFPYFWATLNPFAAIGVHLFFCPIALQDANGVRTEKFKNRPGNKVGMI